MTLIAFLLPFTLLLLVLGLVYPPIVLPTSDEQTRRRVLLFYGPVPVILGAVLLAVNEARPTPGPATVTVDGDTAGVGSAGLVGSVVPDPADTLPFFVGTVVYETSVAGTDSFGVGMFRDLGPDREIATWGSGGRLRVETEGGLTEGVAVARLAEGDSTMYVLKADSKTAYAAYLQDMSRTLPGMESLAAPAEMEWTDEERTVAGRRCRVYNMTRSRLLRFGAKAKACLAEDVRFRPTRFNFSRDPHRTMAALPLQYGIREGAPLWLEVNERGAIVTYTAVSLDAGEPAESRFAVPDGYTVRKRGEALE